MSFSIQHSAFSIRLLTWFAANKRDLPWRAEPRDPYHVWLAEIMLQQTGVETVIPYYARWLARFPTLAAFAAAPLDDALKLWEGLGYYSRVRHFHHAAQVVVQEHAGQIPNTVDGLLALPGIGAYTAGAIASLAFAQDAPLVDGNVRRVLGRAFAGDPRDTWQLARDLLPPGHAGEFNEALMDLGATICTPKSPRCLRQIGACPVMALCRAYALGDPESHPPKKQKPATPHRAICTVVLQNPRGCWLMGQRPARGLLGGLWEFPSTNFDVSAEGSRADMAAQAQAMLAEKCGLGVDIGEENLIGAVKHAFTHFKITRHVFFVHPKPRRLAQKKLAGGTLAGQPARLESEFYQLLRFVSREELAALALTRSDLRIVEMVESHVSQPPKKGR